MTTHLQRRRLVTRWAATTSLIVTVAGAAATVDSGALAASTLSDPVVETESGSVGGVAADGGFVFRGLPYAAPRPGLRWRPPQDCTSVEGRSDASEFAPSCPQQPGLFAPPGDERGLPLPQRVHAGTRRYAREPAGARVDPRRRTGHDGARNYDPTSWRPRARWS